MTDEKARFEQLIDNSKAFAKENNFEQVSLEHILYKFVEETTSQKLFKKYNVNYADMLENIDEYLKEFPRSSLSDKDVEDDKKLVEFFISAFYTSNAFNKSFIKNKDSLYFINTMSSFLAMNDTIAYEILSDFNITKDLLAKIYMENSEFDLDEKILKEVEETLNENNGLGLETSSILSSPELFGLPKKGSVNPLKQYMIDYLSPYLKKPNEVIGREDELTLSQQILLRKDKPNLIIVGKSGIGKSLLVKELSKRIHYNNTKINFFQLDTYALTANVMLKGEIETRIKSIYDTLKDAGETILFIDNIHNICSGDDSSLQGSISNALKSFMDNSNIKIIGTTIPEEYRKSIEKDEVFAKKFYKLSLEEPSIEETRKIIKTKKKEYEKFYKCKYPTKILDLIMDVSDKYLKNRAYPEKALDVMDMIGASAVYSHLKTIDEETAYKTLSSLLAIPMSNISQSEEDLYRTLEDRIKQEIIGQDEAISKVSDSIIISRSGLRESNKTAVSLMFTGSSGVGKTELCRVLSKIMGIPLVRFDMSEYMEDHSVSKLLGSPPGYKDSGNGKAGNGLLINEIDEHPYCILLLDEIEKAHPKIHNLLLQVMDNGKITSSMGKSVSFEHVFLIMTSNVGSQVSHKRTIGFGNTDDNEPMVEAFNESFLPEFRSRIDSTINFNNLSEDILKGISVKFLEELKKTLLEKRIKFKYTEKVVSYITEKAQKINNGARPIKHIITNEIKNTIAKEIVFGKYVKGGLLSIDIKDDKVSFGE